MRNLFLGFSTRSDINLAVRKTTENGKGLEISDLESRGIVFTT